MVRLDTIDCNMLSQSFRKMLWVEHVIWEQNMAEVFPWWRSIAIFLQRKEHNQATRQWNSPEELEEAISGLIFVSSRARDFPELLHIRDIFTAKSEKQYAADSIESHSCSVNLQELTAENGISLRLGGHTVARKFIARAEHDKGDSSAQSSHSHGTHGHQTYSQAVVPKTGTWWSDFPMDVNSFIPCAGVARRLDRRGAEEKDGVLYFKLVVVEILKAHAVMDTVI
ncbi:hypothetical protein AKJ16_DCAP12251 [Drosera capensis]